MLLASIFVWMTAFLAGAALLAILLISFIRNQYFSVKSDPHKATVAFFHPYCAAGGGGERVLWCAIASLIGSHHHKYIKIIIYSGEPAENGDEILEKARKVFGIDIPEALDIKFVHVPHRELLEAGRYPRLTMLGQSVGSVVHAWHALRAFNPDVFIDTTGYAFSFIVAKLLAGCKVGCYVHYPTITRDMINKVIEMRPDYNNNSAVAASVTLTRAKLYYYRIFAWLYSIVGGLTDVVMVNSSWTKGHIDSLWRLPAAATDNAGSQQSTAGTAFCRPVESTQDAILRALDISGTRPCSKIVFPPCNTARLSNIPIGHRERVVVSLGQFRPEKDHATQLRAFAIFRQRDAENEDVKLVLVGGARNEEDLNRVADLRQLAQTLGIANAVEFNVNAPYEELEKLLASATVGIHTMWNEHFGIGIVEMMAAGLIVVANASGGPKLDIVVPFEGDTTGFVASTPEEYADHLHNIFSGKVDCSRIAKTARLSVERFGDEEFSLSFFAAVIPLVNLAVYSAKFRRRQDNIKID